MTIRAVFAAALLTFTSPALAQSLDQFGQAITPQKDALVDQARTLRLPYGKTVQKAREDAKQSIAILEPILAEQPDYYRALFNLGLAQHEAGDYASANATFDKAIEVRQRLAIPDISLLNSAGWVSMENGDYATAEKRLLAAYEQLDQGSPQTRASVLNNLGQLYFYTQRFDEAEKYLNVAKNEFNSRAAAETLGMISKTNKIFNIQQELKK